jgi:hypothetical protein
MQLDEMATTTTTMSMMQKPRYHKVERAPQTWRRSASQIGSFEITSYATPFAREIGNGSVKNAQYELV